uniref:COesterase domain-containing protein n=1 Tax=Steinernema glaseri TaxID=37863 RepID=A0A1I8ASY9_9BILA
MDDWKADRSAINSKSLEIFFPYKFPKEHMSSLWPEDLPEDLARTLRLRRESNENFSSVLQYSRFCYLLGNQSDYKENVIRNARSNHILWKEYI